MGSPLTGSAGVDRAVLVRRIRLLVVATIAYNVIEATAAIVSGVAASSTALIGFGLDSVIEVSSAAAVAWQFSARHEQLREAREHIALRVTAISFLALATYVSVAAIRGLVGTSDAHPSLTGIVLAAASLFIMPILSALQRRAGRALGSASAVADSRQTLLCTYLSGVLLAGLVVNALLGWGWADPAAGLVIAAVAVKEGRDAWRGDACCPPGPAYDSDIGTTTYTTAAGTAPVDEAVACCPECDCSSAHRSHYGDSLRPERLLVGEGKTRGHDAFPPHHHKDVGSPPTPALPGRRPDAPGAIRGDRPITGAVSADKSSD